MIKKYKSRTLKALQKEADEWNETMEQHRQLGIPVVSVSGRKLEGLLLHLTYQARKCGCRVIGHGSLRFPLTVSPCKKHKD